MQDKVFLDTNILIYLYSTDEPEKQRISQQLIEKTTCTISTQVLNEFCNILSKKYKVAWNEIEKALDEVLSQLSVIPISVKTIKRSLTLAAKYGFSYFDALILSSALEIGSHILYSEDMQHQQLIEKQVRIINPFFVSGDQERVEK